MFKPKFLKKEVSLRSCGYTLIELLVSLSLFAIISTFILTILVISLRSTTKTDNIILVKQNGSYALSQMVKQIRYAETLTSPVSCYPTTTTSSITITSPVDQLPTTFSCPTGTSSTISSNSATLLDNTAVAVNSCSFTCSQASSATPPSITIQFTLKPQSSTTSPETTATIPFQTTVSLRNIGQ